MHKTIDNRIFRMSLIDTCADLVIMVLARAMKTGFDFLDHPGSSRTSSREIKLTNDQTLEDGSQLVPVADSGSMGQQRNRKQL